MKLRKVSEEVFVAEAPIVRIGAAELGFLEEQVLRAPRGRARICAHPSDDDPLHEMFIAIRRSSYIRPHRHLQKSESFHVVRGAADVVLLDDAGEVADLVEIGEPGSGRHLYYRLSRSLYHTLLIQSEVLIVHESTTGPFDRERTALAPFAPEESATDQAREYMARLASSVDQWRRSRKGGSPRP